MLLAFRSHDARVRVVAEGKPAAIGEDDEVEVHLYWL